MNKFILGWLIVFCSPLSWAENYAAPTPTYGNLKLQTVTKNMNDVQPRIKAGEIASASIIFDHQNIQLILQKNKTECPEKMLCAQMMPPPVVISLAIVDIRQTECYVTYVAQSLTKDLPNEQITIYDGSSSVCVKPMIYPPRPDAVIIYEVIGPSSVTRQIEKAVAKFNLIGNWIPTLE